MHLAGEATQSVHDPMGGNGWFHEMALIHGPSHHTGRSAGSECGRDGAIGGNTAFGDLAYQLKDRFKEGAVFFSGGLDLLQGLLFVRLQASGEFSGSRRDLSSVCRGSATRS